MTQLTLDYPPTAANHPATSHEAAERIAPKTRSIRARVLEMLQERAMTDRELFAEWGRRHEQRESSTVRARRIELVASGAVEATGMERGGMTVWGVVL